MRALRHSEPPADGEEPRKRSKTCDQLRGPSSSARLGMTAFSLRREDCVRGMTKLRAASIDLAVTSPPYNLGIRYSKFSDRSERGHYLSWCKAWASQIARVLKNDGSFFLNVGSSPSNPFFPHQLVLELRGFFVLQNTVHWIKSISISSRRPVGGARATLQEGQSGVSQSETATVQSFGHFKPINSQRFVNDCHEYIFHLTKSGTVKLDRLALGVPYQDKSNITRWSHTRGRDRRCRGNTWFIPYETIQRREKERPHPATFPVALAENCIRLHGIERAQTMLDPFLGIGNSAIAAKNCSVKKFIGFEIDPAYLAEAKRRVTQASQPDRSRS